MSPAKHFGHGLVIGKFYPYHRGHRLLVETALQQSKRVTVIVCWNRRQSIPGELRADWIRTLHPQVELISVDEDAYGLADDDSVGWAAATRELLGGSPDAVFSEPYGEVYAQVLGCAHVSVDPGRTHVPVSGARIREQPLAHLQWLDGPVRAWFVKRVLLLGAESSGKTTLAQALAERFGTLWVPEYGRPYSLELRERGSPWRSEELVHIGRVQRWLEDQLAEQANKLLFCDTDAWVTGLFHEAYLGTLPPPELQELAHRGRYDLIVVCDIDIPFVQDGERMHDWRREWMQQRSLEHAGESGAPWLLASGSRAERESAVARAVQALLVPAAEIG